MDNVVLWLRVRHIYQTIEGGRERESTRKNVTLVVYRDIGNLANWNNGTNGIFVFMEFPPNLKKMQKHKSKLKVKTLTELISSAVKSDIFSMCMTESND